MHPRSKPCKTYNCFQKFCIVSYALQNIYKCWWMTRTINILAASASNKKKETMHLYIYIIYIYHIYICMSVRTVCSPSPVVLMKHSRTAVPDCFMWWTNCSIGLVVVVVDVVWVLLFVGTASSWWRFINSSNASSKVVPCPFCNCIMGGCCCCCCPAGGGG